MTSNTCLISVLIFAIVGCKNTVKSTVKEDDSATDSADVPTPDDSGESGAINVTIGDLLTKYPQTWDLSDMANPQRRVFIPVPLIRQSRNFTCGVASLQSVLRYYGQEFREGPLQRLLQTDRNNGTPYLNIYNLVKASLNDPTQETTAIGTNACEEEFDPEKYTQCVTGVAGLAPTVGKKRRIKRQAVATGHRFDIEIHTGIGDVTQASARYADAELYPEEKGTLIPKGDALTPEKLPANGMTMAMLEKSLMAGHPVIVLLQAWEESKKTDNDWYSDYADGHYVVVNGFDKANIYMMDPSTNGAWAYVARNRFAHRWHDEDDGVGVPASDTAHCKIDSTDGTTGVNCVRHFGMIVTRTWRGDPVSKEPRYDYEPVYNFMTMHVPRMD